MMGFSIFLLSVFVMKAFVILRWGEEEVRHHLNFCWCSPQKQVNTPADARTETTQNCPTGVKTDIPAEPEELLLLRRQIRWLSLQYSTLQKENSDLRRQLSFIRDSILDSEA